MNPVIDEFDRVLKFLFESGNEIIRPVLEQNHEAEGEKHKQQEPKKTADQTHAADVNLPASSGQRSSIPLIRHRTAPMLR